MTNKTKGWKTILKTIAGVALIIAGCLLAVFLIVDGRPIFPHFLGPIILAGAGMLILVVKRKEKRDV